MLLRAQYLPWYTSWKGLLGTKTPRSIHFATRFGIHTFGMRYPIDVIILDQHAIVKKIQTNLLPNHFFFWNPKYFHVVELPSGTIDQKKIRIGSKITFRFI